MNNVAIQRELTNAAKGHDYFRPNSRVVISAIIPDSVNCEPLEKLASEQDNFVSITRTSKKLTKGYMVFDNWGVGAWNSKIKTSYIPERNKGVIGRTVIPDNRSAIEYERDFKTHIEKLQNWFSTPLSILIYILENLFKFTEKFIKNFPLLTAWL